MHKSDWETVRRLLVVCVDQTLVQLSPALQTLRAARPDVAITLLTSAIDTEVKTVLPWVNDVIHYASWWQNVTAQKQLIERIRDRQFDAAIIFTSETRSPLALAYLCYLTGIPIRIGQSKEFGGGVLSHWVKPPIDNTAKVDPHLYLLESAGILLTHQSLVISH